MIKFKKLTDESETEAKGILPYPQVPVVLTYHNFGSCWCCILRGSTENIDLVFNGFYNLCATNGEYQFFDHLKTVAVFWSTRERMRRFFFMQKHAPEVMVTGRTIRNAMRYARKQLDALSAHGHEFFINFDRQFAPLEYGSGTITAERPDSDFKDSVLANAFASKD